MDEIVPEVENVDYSQFSETEEEQNLYKFLYVEDGHIYPYAYEAEDNPSNNYDTCDEFDDFGYFEYNDEIYDDDEYLDTQYKKPIYRQDEYQEDDHYNFDYEDRVLGNSGKSGSSKSLGSSEKVKKPNRASRGTSIGSIKKGSKSEDNLKSLERRKSKNTDSGGSKNQKTSGKHSVLDMVEATKRTDYWSVLDDHDCQTVLEYGVVVKILGYNHFEIFCGFQTATGVTLKGFYKHFPKVEEGDVIVYRTIDSNFNFQLNKVYITAKCELEEIRILYHRGELSPRLYNFHQRIREQSSKVLTSNKGNTLQDFLYQTPKKNAVHAAEESKYPSLSPSHSSPSQEGNPKQQSSRQLKELYHFNSMILEKIIDYFVDYLQKQSQMKSMIIKITNNTIRTSGSVSSFQPTTGSEESLSNVAEEEDDDENDDEEEEAESRGNSTDDAMTPKPKATKKLEKSKSKVGILLYLFFLESLHHVLYSLPFSQSSHHAVPAELLENPRYLRGQAFLQAQQRQGIQRLFGVAITSYNMNNCIGKLIRFLFQQMLYYLCDNYSFYRHQESPQKDFLNDLQRLELSESSHPSAPSRSVSQQHYHQIIERISHMDIITNILPFLDMEDLYQCFFLLFPQSLLRNLDQAVRKPSSGLIGWSSSNLATNASTSVFQNLDNLKMIIQHFFHEINQNPQYIGIAHDIYDIFSCNIDWERFLTKL